MCASLPCEGTVLSVAWSPDGSTPPAAVPNAHPNSVRAIDAPSVPAPSKRTRVRARGRVGRALFPRGRRQQQGDGVGQPAGRASIEALRSHIRKGCVYSARGRRTAAAARAATTLATWRRCGTSTRRCASCSARAVCIRGGVVSGRRALRERAAAAASPTRTPRRHCGPHRRAPRCASSRSTRGTVTARRGVVAGRREQEHRGARAVSASRSAADSVRWAASTGSSATMPRPAPPLAGPTNGRPRRATVAPPPAVRPQGRGRSAPDEEEEQEEEEEEEAGAGAGGMRVACPWQEDAHSQNAERPQRKRRKFCRTPRQQMPSSIGGMQRRCAMKTMVQRSLAPRAATREDQAYGVVRPERDGRESSNQ